LEKAMQQISLLLTLWEQIISPENLLLATNKAAKGKSSRKDVALFLLNREQELFMLNQQLCNCRYQPGDYRRFSLYEKKPRIISVAPFRDRVVHHALMNIIEPIIDRHLVKSCFACRKGKGVHAAVNYYQQNACRFAYVLKMDVKLYFPSIDHSVLKRQYRKLLFEDAVIELLDIIVDSNKNDKGLPIGNLTSQVLANLHLHCLDELICSLDGVVYFRYVDDIFVLSNNKSHLWEVANHVNTKLANLKLQSHTNKTHIFQTREKVDVLGYKVTPNKRWLRNENGHRYNRKLKALALQYAKNNMSLADIAPSVCSWIGHAQHAQTQGLREAILSKVLFVRQR
jgi:RNA-directed DNA polymerase